MFLSCLKDAPKVSCVRLPLSSRCWGPASWQGLTPRCWELWVVGLPMVAYSCASSVRLAGLSRWQWPGSHSMGWEISYANANKLKFAVCVMQLNRSFLSGGSVTAVCQGFPLIVNLYSAEHIKYTKNWWSFTLSSCLFTCDQCFILALNHPT